MTAIIIQMHPLVKFHLVGKTKIHTFKEKPNNILKYFESVLFLGFRQ